MSNVQHHMEKTKEEIRAAVLAECERLRNELCPSFYPPHDTYPEITTGIVSGVVATYTIWPFGPASSTPIVLDVSASSHDKVWPTLYRMMGLQAREAVAAKDAEIEQLKAKNEELFNECVHRQRCASVANDLYDLIILAHQNGVPMITKAQMYLNGSPYVPFYTWASTTHENPITHIIDILAQRDAVHLRLGNHWNSVLVRQND